MSGGTPYFFWLGAETGSRADDPACIVPILESILPYIQYAAGKELPNAAYYADLIDSLIWRRA